MNEEIYLPDIDNNIYVRSLMETTLDCRKIKNKSTNKKISELENRINNLENK